MHLGALGQYLGLYASIKVSQMLIGLGMVDLDRII